MPRLAEQHRLSRRQRQILDVIHRLDRATAAQVQEALPDAPTVTAVRTLLTIMENEGLIQHVQEGRHYVYSAVQPRQTAARSALEQVMRTFFGGSVEQVVSTLLSNEETHLSADQIDRLTALIEAARSEEDTLESEQDNRRPADGERSDRP